MNELIAVTTLHTFRHALYGCFERRADALMELTDALLTAGPVLSPAHLSLEAVHRRGWGSHYAPLTEGRVNDTALRDLFSRYPLADGQPIYAVDCSVWARQVRVRRREGKGRGRGAHRGVIGEVGECLRWDQHLDRKEEKREDLWI